MMEYGKEGVEKWCEDWGLKGNQCYEGHGVFETRVRWGLLTLCGWWGNSRIRGGWNRKGMGSNDLVPHILFPLQHFDLIL